MNELDYYSAPSISNSDLENYMISPELFLAIKKGTYKKIASQAMNLGSIKHEMILRPEIFFQKYYIQSEVASPKQTEFIEEIIKERNEMPFALINEDYDRIHKKIYSTSKPGDGSSLFLKLSEKILATEKKLTPISGGTWNDAKKASELVLKNETARKLLKRAPTREEEIYFTYNDMPCKSKIDAFGFPNNDNGIIVDLKTHSVPISKTEFIERILFSGIARQMSFYELALKHSEGYKDLFDSSKPIEKYIISVDPVMVRIYQCKEETGEMQVKIISQLLEEIKNKTEKNLWFNESEVIIQI